MGLLTVQGVQFESLTHQILQGHDDIPSVDFRGMIGNNALLFQLERLTLEPLRGFTLSRAWADGRLMEDLSYHKDPFEKWATTYEEAIQASTIGKPWIEAIHRRVSERGLREAMAFRALCGGRIQRLLGSNPKFRR